MSQAVSDPVAVRLPADVLKDVNEISEASDRSRSWVILRALRLYLATEGADILAIARARSSASRNVDVDIDDVIADVERIVAGNGMKAA
jgi:predicted transcriptional regulator